jgi:EmrB/QacA subfamily drug resistance transporter
MTTSTDPSLTERVGPANEPRSDRGDRRAAAALAVLLTASFTLAVDFSILNVALPRIGADVGFGLGSLQWISTAFAICAAGFTLVFGRCADLFGRRRQFLAGIALLGVASLAGGLAQSPALLIGARLAQGLATAAVIPAALSLLTTTFPEGPRRERALGLNGALMAAGFTSGAVAGGLLTDLISWRWAFFLNVAVAAGVLVLGPRVLTEVPTGTRRPLDLPGAGAVTGALVALTYGLTEAGERGWGDRQSWPALVVAALLIVGFAAIEHRVRDPLVPLPVLRHRSVATGNVVGILAFATETSLVFLLTLYLQQVLGFSPLQAGLSFAVLGAGTVLGGMLGPRLIGRMGNRAAVAVALAVQAAATGPMVALGRVDAWLALVLVATFVGGVANLVAIVGFMVTATSGRPDDEQGLATGLATMSQQLGITLGTPIMSAVATGVAHGSGVLTGLRVAIGVDAAVCLAAAVLAGLLVPEVARRRQP